MQARGGTVALLLPPRYLTGWIPEPLDGTILGRAGIRSIHRRSGAAPAEPADPAGRAAVRFFARAVHGDLDAAVRSGTPGSSAAGAASSAFATAAATATTAAPEDDLRNHPPDAWPRGPISEFEIAANLSQLFLAKWRPVPIFVSVDKDPLQYYYQPPFSSSSLGGWRAAQPRLFCASDIPTPLSSTPQGKFTSAIDARNLGAPKQARYHLCCLHGWRVHGGSTPPVTS